MSSGADCHITEKEPGKWVYDLQQWPYGAIEDYDRFGPFPSFVAAHDHLGANHQNPGGYSIRVHPDHVHNGEQVEIEGLFGQNPNLFWTCCDQEVNEGDELEA